MSLPRLPPSLRPLRLRRFLHWFAAALALPAGLAAQAAPESLPGARSFIYRDLPDQPLRLHVFSPEGHRVQDRRPAFVFFFGGGWSRGTPERSASWARLAASWGLVGIAPDYRTKERFNTTPIESVADGRTAIRWIQEHAAELGVDPTKVVVGGSSAGGHLALWTAIVETPAGSDPAENPLHQPAALVLVSAPTDLTHPSLIRRFGPDISKVSPLQHIVAPMPPIIHFHGDADTTVPFEQATALEAKMSELGQKMVLVRIEGGTHSFGSQFPEWRERSRSMVRFFLQREGILPE